MTVRPEQEIFDDLVWLCANPGYAHAVAFLCYRDHIVGYGDELKPKDYAKLFSRERLIRTEVATLTGDLMSLQTFSTMRMAERLPLNISPKTMEPPVASLGAQHKPPRGAALVNPCTTGRARRGYRRRAPSYLSAFLALNIVRLHLVAFVDC